ncbi:FecR domain-containing protein [Pseudomonas mangiferae]|uniref:DUF4880 domain-containing protein n=1 Tax=Pseudomonas mangiferae TaxID=2593654 RepID=A0A553GU80_9PSED|nr:FecR domain-containing protein [Pseudomonas mangiferae]TRX73068.1 DUF4880 domain-containing protein [Pseudomonas mangiferae]
MSALDPRVARQAAEWFVLLQDPDAAPAEHDACAHWRASHADHEAAWQRALWVSQRVGQLPAAVAVPVLGRRQLARRDVLKSMVLASGGATLAVLGYREGADHHWLADYRTGTGEHARHTLSDGSQLHLDTASAADVRYDAACRRVRLLRGELLVEVATDVAGRPFVVESAAGCAQAPSGRFSLREEGVGSRLTVFEGRVQVRTRSGGQPSLDVNAGEQLLFGETWLGAPTPADPRRDAWTRGVLHVDGMRLDAFAVELQRYRAGVLTCDAAVAALTLSGSYQLANTTPILDSLPGLLPVRVRYRTRYWVSLLPA